MSRKAIAIQTNARTRWATEQTDGRKCRHMLTAQAAKGSLSSDDYKRLYNQPMNLSNMQNVTISRCFVKNGKEIYKQLQHTLTQPSYSLLLLLNSGFSPDKLPKTE